MAWAKFLEKDTNSRAAYAIFCFRNLPSASVIFRYGSIVFLASLLATFLYAWPTMSGEDSGQSNREWAKFRTKILERSRPFLASVCFRQLPFFRAMCLCRRHVRMRGR